MHEVFVDNNGIGISAVNRQAVMAEIIIGLDRGYTAKLLLPVLAVWALPAGINHHAHPTQITDAELSGMSTERTDTADDLMAGDHREDPFKPFVTGQVNIGMANPAV
ncbi:hypothetical protein GCM10010967_56650 [Dyadobacter beijingensis]|uniref:Uncharacterized protein n=1 Tax=Dyadobacter beijingensis TaxID=365489 RepID=A0ABQ2IKF3_9BACT|nr:hypothetical protein GCM10010967_56650 [Dyadobacter beijingensis]